MSYSNRGKIWTVTEIADYFIETNLRPADCRLFNFLLFTSKPSQLVSYYIPFYLTQMEYWIDIWSDRD